MEEWKRIYGLEVSNRGRVRGLDGRFRYLQRHNGYLIVEHAGKRYRVHRLVLEAFVGQCPLGLQTRHLDGVPTNNCLENLCWGTAQENCLDRAHHERWKTVTKLDAPKVRAILKGLQQGYKGKTLAKRYNVVESVISEIRHGKRWQYVPRP